MMKVKTFVTAIFRTLSKRALFLFVISAFCLGIGSGWILKDSVSKEADAHSIIQVSSAHSLHIDGYNLVSPLLLSNSAADNPSTTLNPLQKKITDFITNQEQKKNITDVSVYLRDFTTGYTIDINPDEKYYPASMNKIPLMMAVYRTAEKNSAFLNSMVTAPAIDENTGLEIIPAHFMAAGSSATVQEALNDLIIYSDNNAFFALSASIDQTLYTSIFSDLQIPLRTSNNQPTDYMTAKDFSYFFRVLHNGTYLGRDDSENALELLAKSDFEQGLRAGVPGSVTVADKFGIYTNNPGGIFVNRELHDCGIVYQPGKSYIVCVMSKSTATLAQQENVIAGISSVVFKGL